MFKKIVALVLSLLLIAIPLQAVKAAEKAEYKYKVVIYAGNQGTIKGQTEYVIPDITSGDGITIDLSTLDLDVNSKYYVRGLKLAGHDNDDMLTNLAFEVTEDVSLVVSYGVRDDGMVNYTVKFLEKGTNKKLADEVTYEGRVGDRPIVSHKYVEGYIPDALNRTGTLKSNEADNEFIFYYTKADHTNTVYETIYGPGGGGGGGGGTTPSGGGETPSGGGGEEPVNPSGGGGEELPPEIIDDDNPPLAPGGDDNGGGNGGGNGGNSYWIPYVAGAAGIAAVGAGIYLMVRNRRKEDEDEEE